MLPRSDRLVLAVVLLIAATGRVTAQAPPHPAAPRVTTLAGGRDQPGLFAQRLLFPANFCGAIHTHDRHVHALVLRGALRLGLADSLDHLVVRDYPVGSFLVIPAGRAHVDGTVSETEVYLSGIGPLKTVVLDSTTPRRCEPTPGN